MNNVLQDPRQDQGRIRNEVWKYVLATAAVCAGIATVPIPIADFFILTPIQAGMVLWIGTRYGHNLTPQKAKDILVEIGSVVGMGYIAQQTVLAIYKLIPILGGLLGAPAVFAVTAGIGKAAILYFESGMSPDPKQIKEAFENGKNLGERIYRTKPVCYKKPQVVPLNDCKSCDWRSTCKEGFTPLRIDRS